jgi:predicted nucleic acid-binding protein
MGLEFLWDTNTVIYYLQKQFPPDAEVFIDGIVEHNQPVISVITEIELLCWRTAGDDSLAAIRDFISRSVVYELDEVIKLKTIEVRKQFKLKLPDAVIAASALVNDHTLITRNMSDFGKISTLKSVNPF